MNLLNAVRIATLNLHKSELNYALSFDENDYRRYIDIFRNEVLGFVPADYLAYFHEHEDFYYHTTKKDKADKIVKSTYLELKYGSEYSGVGKAIYTFPASSGRCYSSDDCVTLKFKTKAKHFHITGSNDSIHALGECVFKEDKLFLEDLQILTGNDLEIDRENSFNMEKCLYHDFGFSKLDEIPDNLDLYNLEKFIQKYFSTRMFNDIFYSEATKEF